MNMSAAILILLTLVVHVCAKNVLFLYPNASPSHKNIAYPIMHGLAERGHNVTVVTTFKTPPHPRIRDVIPFENFEYFAPEVTALDMRRQEPFLFMIRDWTPILQACELVLQSEEFMELLNQKFDLVLMDVFVNECLLGFVYRLGAPLILISPLPVPSYITELLGNRLPPSITPFFLGEVSRNMGFMDRVYTHLMTIAGEWAFQRPVYKHEELYKKYLGSDLPCVDEILSNVSLIMSNSHFAFNLPRPTMPGVVEIGGIHCRPGKPLPKEINEFVSGAKDGVILFSLGSIVRPLDLPESTRKVFVNVFGRLKQRVLWRWPIEMADRPPNVMLSKWIPQQDVLAHSNTKLFITHAGLLSMQESMYHGVPMVTVPVFCDQDIDARFGTEVGIATRIEILSLTEQELETAINEVLNNATYKERVLELSKYLRDQPETPKERGVFWAEYVMNHKGAMHLRAAARELNFFQYHCLDVIAALLGLILVVLSGIFMIVRKVMRSLISFTAGAGGVSAHKKHQ